jgi:hypothetical protein
LSGRGAKWTSLHKPIRIAEVMYNSPISERDKTVEIIKLYGWENVRGGPWCRPEYALEYDWC